MLKIKKYANGRFFDTTAKKYIKPEKLAELIKKGEEIQVTLTKTGKDITDTVIEQFTKKEKKEKKGADFNFLKTDKFAKWVGEIIDSKIEKVMEIVKLPSREQVAKLDENIKELNKKIDALKLHQEKEAKKKAAPAKKAPEVKKAPEAKEEDVKTTPEKKPASV